MDEEALKRFFLDLDRSFFLEGGQKHLAKRDAPLSIGYGQTISQPSLVLDMTRLLDPEEDSRVLEIGTGSGYQTAILAEFSGQVYTVERIPALMAKARSRLEDLGYHNIHYKVADGSEGWPDQAPFDRIMVTAAAGRRPGRLLDQLAPGGRLLIPLGPPYMQELFLFLKDKEGRIREKRLGPVRFVELVGPYGWGEDEGQ